MNIAELRRKIAEAEAALDQHGSEGKPPPRDPESFNTIEDTLEQLRAELQEAEETRVGERERERIQAEREVLEKEISNRRAEMQKVGKTLDRIRTEIAEDMGKHFSQGTKRWSPVFWVLDHADAVIKTRARFMGCMRDLNYANKDLRRFLERNRLPR